MIQETMAEISAQICRQPPAEERAAAPVTRKAAAWLPFHGPLDALLGSEGLTPPG